MKQDNQTKQLIILGVLAVILVGYLAYTFLSQGTANASTNKNAPSSATETATVDDEANQQNGVAGVVPNTVFPGLSTPSPRRDPFSVQYTAVAQVKTPVVAQTRSARVPALSNPLKPLNPFKAATSTLPAVQNIAVIPPERPVLSGVLLGENNIAVLKYLGKTHVVREGSYVAGKFRLLRVTKNGVVLQDRGTQLRIGLGGLR